MAFGPPANGSTRRARPRGGTGGEEGNCGGKVARRPDGRARVIRGRAPG